jgi:hypothetical protein
MITSSTNELIRICTVQIFVSEQKCGYGFFVAPDKLLTCAHVIVVPESEIPKKIASDIKIHLSDKKIVPAEVMVIDEEVDLALLSVELTDHPCLPLNEDVVSFDVLRVRGHKALKVKGFAGDAEKIMFEADGEDIGPGDSGKPLFNPRTRGICGFISGRMKTKTVHATHIKNVLKKFPKLANKPIKIFIVYNVYNKNDEALFNKLVQSLRDLHLTNPSLYCVYDEESETETEREPWTDAQPRHPPATFETSQIIALLVSSNPYVSNGYFKMYIPRAEARSIQVLPPNVSPVPDWPQESIAIAEFPKRIREIIEAFNSSNPS